MYKLSKIQNLYRRAEQRVIMSDFKHEMLAETGKKD